MEPHLPPDQTPPTADAPSTADEPPAEEPSTAAEEPPAEEPATATEEPPAGSSDPLPPPPSGGWAPPFQFLRSRHERKLGGVAGGLAAAAGLDPTLVRLAVVLGCLTGWGILGYLIAWVVIPEEDPATGRYLVAAPERTAKHIRIGLAVLAGLGVLHVVGAILGIISSALIGLGLFPARLFGLSHRGFMPGEALLGLFLLVGGLLLLFRRHLPWAPAADTGSGPAWFSGPVGARPWTAVPGAGGAPAPVPAPAPDDLTGSGGPRAAAASAAARASAAATTAARLARSNGPLLIVRAAGWLVGLWFLAAAAVGAGLWITGAVHVHLPLLPIVAGVGALGVLGWTLIRSRRLAAVVGAMALLLVPAALAAALGRVDGQAGHRSVTPVVMADLDRNYRHAAGLFELDLSRLQLPAGETPVHISMGAGKVDVTVPWDAEVQATASVGAGTFDLFGNRQSGVNLKGRSHSNGQAGGAVLVISGRAGAGAIEIHRGSEPFTHEALRTGQPVPMECDLTAATTAVNGGIAGGPIPCRAADGVTVTPALNCVVAGSGGALCRPVGEPEPSIGFAGEPGTRHCQVPAGGGDSTCTAPVAENAPPTSQPAPATPTPSPTAPTPPGAAPGQYLCTIPDGGGPASCRPA